MSPSFFRTKAAGVFTGGVLLFAASCSGETNNVLARPSNKYYVSAAPQNYRSESSTNGLVCELLIESNATCTVYLRNESTNTFYNYWFVYGFNPPKILSKLSDFNLVKIDLWDSARRQVTRMETGRKFEELPSQKKVQEITRNYRREWIAGHLRTSGFRTLRAASDRQYVCDFDLPVLFDLKEPGEYTLCVQIPFIQRIDKRNLDINWTLLPEVVAKIRIQSDDNSLSGSAQKPSP